MHQLTLRQIPPLLDARLRSQARKAGTSINKTIIDLLSQVLIVSGARRKKRDLARLSGAWSAEEAAEFERAVQVFETVDAEVWK